MSKNGTLKYLVKKIQKQVKKADITEDHLWYAIRGALDSGLLISNLAEALRVSAKETEELLKESGFGDLIAQQKIKNSTSSGSERDSVDYIINSSGKLVSPFPELFSIEFSPSLSSPLKLSSSNYEAVSLLMESITRSADEDSFANLYRKNVYGYYEEFLSRDAKRIDAYINKQFPNRNLKYMVNSGMGANEQFNHFLAYLNNTNQNRRVTWLIIDSPKRLMNLPADATIENTLFMEFSRSGKTEETIKIHEFTPREARRIVFANSGPLREIGNRDGNLVLDLPDQVSGRFGRNKTPILLAPMYVSGMDVDGFWRKIEESIAKLDISSPFSIPAQIAQFIYLYQQQNQVNQIYLGCNHDVLTYSSNEFIQFWNEGVNKSGNDIMMSGYFGLLRDSHANVEGILANRHTKMAIMLFADTMHLTSPSPMIHEMIDPINSKHIGLRFGDDELILAEANYERFIEVMPTIKITVHGNLTSEHAAVLGQLWSDITFFYSKMKNVDPGSNPEVKFVRDRSAKLLADGASRRKR